MAHNENREAGRDHEGQGRCDGARRQARHAANPVSGGAARPEGDTHPDDEPAQWDGPRLREAVTGMLREDRRFQ